MDRFKTTAWYKCSNCKKVLHGENFYRLPNGCRTNECCKCYGKHITQQQTSEIKTSEAGSRNTLTDRVRRLEQDMERVKKHIGLEEADNAEA